MAPIARRLGLQLRRLKDRGLLPTGSAPARMLARLAGRWIDVSAPFYEASEQGQLVAKERALVRQTVLDARPRVCVELGTWRGGGSTYQIASALAESGTGGLLHTFEPDPEALQTAIENYRREASGLLPYIRFHGEDFRAGLTRAGLEGIDFALLDGPDDAEYTRAALRALAAPVTPGAFVILHDWHVEKCRAVRSEVAASDHWIIDTVYSDTPTGLARLRRRRSSGGTSHRRRPP